MNEHKRKLDKSWDDKVAQIAAEVAQEQAATKAEVNRQLAEKGKLFEQGFRNNSVHSVIVPTN